MSATEAAAAPVRRAVYGRNYSYFSHRIFVAFMPEDLHDYLYRLMRHEPSGSADDASELIDMQLVRWVLLHRSQLNALALNRELEAWRAPGDVLRLPASNRLRSDDHHRLDITLQFALELELAVAREAPLPQKRPRLQLALLDAAFYVSRLRADHDRRPRPAAGADAEIDVDLSQTGRDAFADYLRQRMNLDEDRSRPPAADEPDAPPLTDDEINWLYGVAIGVARTLSSSADPGDLRRRWEEFIAPRWLAMNLPRPDNALFDVLLTGAQSPLEELPLETGPHPAAAPTESFRFRWRVPPAAAAPWARSLKGLAENSRPARDFIDRIDALLRRAMYGATPGRRDDPERQPLRLLSDHCRVLPTTPAWGAVLSSGEGMRQAEKGLGNVGALQKDYQLLQQYQDLLKSPSASGAVVLTLVVAALLAGARPGPGPGAAAAGVPPRPSPSEWVDALMCLQDGLRLDVADLATAEARLRQVHEQLRQQEQLKALQPLEASVPWPSTEEDLERRVLQAYETGRRIGLGGVPATLLDEAWRQVATRALELPKRQLTLAPAHAAELLCAHRHVGPGSLLPLRLESARYRSWTRVLVHALRPLVATPPAPDAEAPPLVMAAHALERLGMRCLADEAQEALLSILPAADASALRAHAARHGLWQGSGLNARAALVLGPLSGSMSENWSLPPNGGLVLAASEAELKDLKALMARALLSGFSEPLRLVFEPLSPRTTEPVNIPLPLRLPVAPNTIRIWLYHPGQVGKESPQLVAPSTADDLWVAAPTPTPPVPS